MYIQTTATQKLQKLNKRIRGIAGGTSASKTISILLILINYAQTHDNKRISVVSESFPHLKRGAMRDFLTIMQQHKYYKDASWNRTDSVYTFESGSILEFFSADQPGKVRGPRRDVLFINEANNISYETFTQLEVRTSEIIWLDWNPVSEFWFYANEIGGEPAVKDREDCDFLILTYKDNEALDSRLIDAIEARKGNKNWWKVYGMGELGDAEGRIYKDWNTISEIPHEAVLRRYGLDFGYTNDPTAIVAIYYYNGGYILHEICYNYKMSNQDIADRLFNEQAALVVADSTEPKSIAEIKRQGINIKESQKGRGSVLQGIQYVQQQRISVTKQSLNLLREYRNYLWITDKNGKIINEPQDFLNHCMDAIRYGMDSFRPLKPILQDTDPGGVLPFIEGIG